MDLARKAATEEEVVEEEWIESPNGWTDPKYEAKDEEDDDDDENDGGMLDMFADTDPRDSFPFEIKIHHPESKEEKTTKTITLQGYKLDSDESAQSTGVTLWQAAPRLAHFLMKPESRELIFGKNVLELGAGLGLVSIVAHHLGAGHVVLTDGDTLTLRQTRQNVQQNCHDNNSNNNIECRQLIWGNPSQLQSLLDKYGRLDTILGADVVYTEASLEPLFDTVAALLEPKSGRFVLSRVTKWNDVSDDTVLGAAKQRKLDCTRPEDGIFIFSVIQ